MPYDTPPERKRLGKALKMLREDAGMTQDAAATAMNQTVQSWQNYEWGQRKFTQLLAERVTKALGATVEDLLQARERVPPELDDQPQPRPSPTAAREREARPFELPVHGVVRAGALGVNVYDAGQEAEVIDFSSFFGADVRVLRLAGESMIPYAEPGGFVTYHLNRWPRRNQGAVIETKAGEYYVKRYDRMTDGTLYVTELHPVEKQLTFEMADIKGVYAIGLRGD